MSDGQDRYILYEYLMFFWNKKWLLLIPPILGIIIPIAIGMVKENPYVGTLTYYVGGTENPKLVNPDIIKSELLSDKISDGVSVVKGDKVISFVSSSQSKSEIKDIFAEVDTQYGKLLGEISEKDLKFDKEYLDNIKQRKKVLEASLLQARKQLEQAKSRSDIDSGYLKSIAQMEKSLSNYTEDIYLQEQRLLNYQEPGKISTTINQQKNHTTSNILVGFILGLFVAVGLVTLWKYILDAKRVSPIN